MTKYYMDITPVMDIGAQQFRFGSVRYVVETNEPYVNRNYVSTSAVNVNGWDRISFEIQVTPMPDPGLQPQLVSVIP